MAANTAKLTEYLELVDRQISLASDATQLESLLEFRGLIDQALQDGNPGDPGNPSSPTSTVYTQVLAADDLSVSYSYSDEGTADERVSAVIYTSASLGKVVTDSFSYAGSSGSYRVTGKSREATDLQD